MLSAGAIYHVNIAQALGTPQRRNYLNQALAGLEEHNCSLEGVLDHIEILSNFPSPIACGPSAGKGAKEVRLEWH